MPANGPPTRNHPGPEATRASHSNTRPGQRHQSKINNEIPQYRLTHILLRWCHNGLTSHPAGNVIEMDSECDVLGCSDSAESSINAGTLDRPGDLGGSDPWEDAESCQHSGNIPRSCVSAR